MSDVSPSPAYGIAPAMPLPDDVYEVRQNALSIGRVYRVTASDGHLAAYAQHPVLRLLEEFWVSADEAQTIPLLLAKRRKFLQINVLFDFFDGPTGRHLFSLQRRTFRSIFRDRLEILDPGGIPIGSVDETGFALARRILKWLPHHWTITVGGQLVARIDQEFTLFAKRVTLDLRENGGRFDSRVSIAASLILMHEVHSASSGGDGSSILSLVD